MVGKKLLAYLYAHHYFNHRIYCNNWLASKLENFCISLHSSIAFTSWENKLPKLENFSISLCLVHVFQIFSNVVEVIAPSPLLSSLSTKIGASWITSLRVLAYLLCLLSFHCTYCNKISWGKTFAISLRSF